MSRSSENYRIDLPPLNDSQLIKIISKVTVPVDYGEEMLNPDLLRISERWNKLAKLCREDKKESYVKYFKDAFNADMNAASEFFPEKFRDRLDGEGDFANYVKNFVDDNFVQCHELAALFFKCLCYIETRTAEEQEQYFLQFPPISNDLNCLNGTFERVSQTYLRLTVADNSQPLLDVHERVLFNLVDRLKDRVGLANQVHIPGYLSKIFDFSKEGPVHPESQISTAELWRIYCDYPNKFKNVISGKDRIEKIEKDFPDVDLRHFDIGNSKLIKAIQESLESFSESSGIGFLEEADDEGKFVSVKFSFLSEVASKMPAVLALRDFVNDEDVLSLADRIDDENGLLEKLKNPSKISPEATIFSEAFVQNFISLLMRANAESANPQDLIFATKLLSIMSNYSLINSSYDIVKRVVDVFDGVELRPEIADAIELAKESSEKFLIKLNQMDFGVAFVKSLITNPTTEELVAEITSGVDLPISADQDYQKAALNLICRPDFAQIFDALKTRIGKDISAQKNKFIDQCFVSASALNKVDVCEKIDADFFVSNKLSIANGLIFQAAAFGMVEMAEFLTYRAIQKNETIEFSLEYSKSQTPAARAASDGKDNILQVFYQSGLDHELINTPCGDRGYMPIDWAVSVGNTNVIKFFFESDLCKRPNDERIIEIIRNAAVYGQDHVLRYLHNEAGVALDLFDYSGDEQYSAIEFAALNNRPEVIKRLISFDIPFDQTYGGGSTLLHIAIRNDHTNQAIEFLCNQGLNPNCQNEKLDTALHIATNQGAVGAIEILGRFGADPMIRNRSNETALDIAVTIQNDEALIALLAISDRNGNSFLHDAVYDESKREVLRNFVDAGVNLRNFNPKNHHNETPLVLAAINKDSEFISIMQSIGVDLYSEDENGFTTITHLIHLQNDVPMNDEIGEIEEALNFWLSLGVDINRPNHRGLSPFGTIVEGLSRRVKNVNGILLLSKYSDLLEDSDRDFISNMSARLKELLDARYANQEYQSNEETNSETEFDAELTPSSGRSSMEPEEKITPRTTPSIDSQAKQLADRSSESDRKI